MELVGQTKTYAVRLVALALGALLCTVQAYGQSATLKTTGLEADKDAYLRMLSLDLTGKLPALSKHDELATLDDVPEDWVDTMLQSPEFASRVVRHLTSLTWNNVENIRFISPSARINGNGTGSPHYRTAPAKYYRGIAGTKCGTFSAVIDANNVIQTQVFQTDAGPVLQEGYVSITTYWSPTVKVKVCAFDAQTALVSPGGTLCHTRDGLKDPGCGCGPDMRWCEKNALKTAIPAAMALSIEKRMAAVIDEGKPYTDLFSDNRMWVNGPIVHFFKYQTEVYNSVRLTPAPFPVELLPDIPYSEKDTWEVIELPPYHAGILTDPMFLLRFQTNRARTNRFHDAFLCDPFQPPTSDDGTGGIDVEGAAADPSPDLQERDGCLYCHSRVEPTAAYWGRWTESGAGYLNPWQFPATRADCESCATSEAPCSKECTLYYQTVAYDPEEVPYLGQLKAYVFRKPDHMDNVEYGPIMLVNQGILDGRLQRCAVTNAMFWLFGRETLGREVAWISALADGFVKSNFDFRQLIKTIVTSPTYRSVR